MLADQSLREAAAPPTPEARTTPTASAITDILSSCHQYALLGTVIGSPGTGKSTAALDYTESCGRGVVYCSMVKTADTVRSGLLHILLSLGGNTGPNAGEYAIHRLVEKGLEDRKTRLLILDEVQYASDELLGCVRDLYDRCDMGIVWIGNFSLSARWSGRRAARKAVFEQILGRLGPRIEVHSPLAGDIEVILRQHGIEDEASRKLLSRAAATDGGLHNVERILRVAQGPRGDRNLSAAALRDAAMVAGVA